MPVIFRCATSGRDPVDEIKSLIRNTLPTPERMMVAGNREIANIKARTASGIDVDGQPFEPYTESYAKQRAKRGLSVSPVNLRATGDMLDSMTTEIKSSTEFAITVTNTKAIIYGPVQNARRQFFDTNAEELDQMMGELFSEGGE